MAIDFIEKRDLGLHMTFQPDKKRPIFNWLYYKEAFSSHLVKRVLNELGIVGPVLDPFVGVGTVPLECKYNGIAGIGVDASPLAVLASRVKTRNYSRDELEMVVRELAKMLEVKNERPRMDWSFELFRPDLVLPQRNLGFIKIARERIERVQNEKVRSFLLLGLLSILPQCSYVLKDGGVLKIKKNKRAADAKAMFKRKIKRMIRDVIEYGVDYDEPEIAHGSAMALNLPDESIGGIITSPPYLNNVDYTKVYGLELSLLDPSMSIGEVRHGMVRSFLKKGGQGVRIKNDLVFEKLVERLGPNTPLIAYAYFTDMLQVIRECGRALRPNGVCAMVVGNSIVERANIETDAILAELALECGMKCEVWVGSVRYADVPVKGKLPFRESCIIMRK